MKECLNSNQFISNLVISLGTVIWQCCRSIGVSVRVVWQYLPMSLSNQRPSGPGLGTSGRLHRAWSWVCFYSVKVQVTCNQGFQFMTHLRVSETLCNKL